MPTALDDGRKLFGSKIEFGQLVDMRQLLQKKLRATIQLLILGRTEAILELREDGQRLGGKW